ncbi:MAG TPA: hypothetical protein VIS52_07035 [Motiliproteus sp.]
MSATNLTLAGLLIGLLLCHEAVAENTSSAAPSPAKTTNAPPKQEPAISIEITGDKEVPLVLYIVPWQNPQAPITDPPQLDDPSLRPLTPCQLYDTLSREELTAWQCPPKSAR